MRRGTWILAISGMMALYQSGNAADPAADQSTGQNAVGTSRTSGKISSSRSANTPEASAQSNSKNYYKDLFGDDTPATDSTNKRNLPASAPSDDEIFTLSPSSGNSAKKKNSDTSLSEMPAKSGKVAVGPGDKSKSGRKVSQANYDRPAGSSASVQQTRSDGRPRSAPPMGRADDPAENTTPKAARTNSVRTVLGPADPISTERMVTTSSPQTQRGPQTPQVTVEWSNRGEFNVGQECLVDLIVKNSGTSAVSQVAVDAFFPTHVRLTAAEPPPASASDRLTWNFDQLPPASEQKISVKLIPSRRGEIGATAQVRFTGTSTATFAVHEPMLKVALKAPPKEIMLGDPASQMITVTNPGTGTAQDVKIEARLSEGLEHPTREDHIILDVGSVGPGESRSYRLGLTASKGGPQKVSVVVMSSSEASSADSVQFNVIAPSLKIAVDGPALRYKGRNAKYTLTVTNDGSLVNNNIHISQVVPEGFKFVSADHQGKFDHSVHTINWFVGRLEPGDSAQVSCELNSHQIGDFAQRVQVVSDSGVQADARIETRVDGIASLTMELVDFDDPVETGSETGYEIRVKNDGSKAAMGVTIACELPAGMELLSAKAPVDRIVEGRQLMFKPIEQIAPGSQVTIRIQMKVVRDGSHRLRASLTGGGLQEPMVLEEVTRAYSDGSN